MDNQMPEPVEGRKASLQKTTHVSDLNFDRNIPSISHIVKGLANLFQLPVGAALQKASTLSTDDSYYLCQFLTLIVDVYIGLLYPTTRFTKAEMR